MRTFPILYKKTAAGKVQIWKVAVRKNKDDTGTIVIEQGQIDGKKQVYEEEILEGKNLGKKNATSAFEQAVAEAEARWTKKKDRHHYGEDVEAQESAKKRAEAPMLAKVYKEFAGRIDWSLAMAQPKLDGNRCLAKRGESGITLWTRKGVQIMTMPHIVEGLKGVMKPGETFDGELYVHGLHVTNLRSLIAKAQPGCENVSFRVYDQVLPADFCTRLHELNVRLGDRVSKPKDGISLVETIRVPNEAELMKFQAECLERGFEGAMLRWGPAGYEAGKRSSGLLKVKTFQDAEFTIVNVVEGKGPYKGLAVFVCKTKAGHTFNVTAPGSLEEKRTIWANREDFIGLRVTVAFQNYTNTETSVPFQPVAKAIRED